MAYISHFQDFEVEPILYKISDDPQVIASYIALYPNQIICMFVDFINECSYSLTQEILTLFLNNGVNIDGLYPFNIDSKELCTVMVYACEYRLSGLISLLLKNGADINKYSLDRDNNNYLSMLLSGHRYDCQFDWESVAECVPILDQYGCEKKILKYIYDEQCSEYIKYSLYMSQYLNGCQIVYKINKRTFTELISSMFKAYPFFMIPIPDDCLNLVTDRIIEKTKIHQNNASTSNLKNFRDRLKNYPNYEIFESFQIDKHKFGLDVFIDFTILTIDLLIRDLLIRGEMKPSVDDFNKSINNNISWTIMQLQK